MTAPIAATTGFLVAAAAAGCATPVAARLAHRLRFYDRPAGYKQHGHATPYLGGLAVIIALLAGILATGSATAHYLPLILATAVIWGLGTVDDRLNLHPLLRVACEVGLGLWMWGAGLGWHLVGPDVINAIVTAGWVVAVVNAFNLMDNMDGTSSTTGAVSAAGLGVFALTNRDPALAAITFGLAGAAAGFLPSNVSRPAKIFLGDGGSMVVGFVVAAAAMSAPQTNALGFGAVLCACMVAGLPLMDTTMVVISRRRRGAPILSGARDHLTHRLLVRLHSPRRVCLVLGFAGAVLAASSVLASHGGRTTVLWVVTVWTVVAIAAIAALERTDLGSLRARAMVSGEQV